MPKYILRKNSQRTTFYLPSFFKILSSIDSADGLLDISCFNCVIMKFKSPYEFGFE